MTFQKFTGKQYLQIDIANNFGLDKKNWNQRLAWFQENEDKLEDLIKQADEPALFYAGVQAWRATQRGEATGYPISLDATSSGLQLLACMVGDRKAAQLCNVVNHIEDGEPQRRDAYTVIFNAMQDLIGESARIERDDVKQAIMTALYGSEAVPKEVFGTGALMGIFEGTMSMMAPGAWELNKAFLALWNPSALMYEWTMPDNFHVKTKVMDTIKETVHFMNSPHEITYKVNQPKESGRSLGANTTHSVDGMVVREVVGRCNYDPEHLMFVKEALCSTFPEKVETENSKMARTLLDLAHKSGFLSVRVLEFIDYDSVAIMTDEEKENVWRLIASMPKKPFEVLTVHDCFRVLSNYGNDLRQQYNQILSNIAKSNILEFLLEQITGRKIPITKIDPDMWKDVLNTEYSLS